MPRLSSFSASFKQLFSTCINFVFRRISLFTLDWGDLDGPEGHHKVGANRPILESLSDILNNHDGNVNANKNGSDDSIGGLSILGPTRQWVQAVDSVPTDDRNGTIGIPAGDPSQMMSDGNNGTIVPPFHADPKLPLCPMIPPGLHGTVKTVTNDVPDTMEELEKLFTYLEPGGRFHPTECTSRHRVAIIVPYRDREDHLRIFLLNIHKFLRPQQIDYAIYLGNAFLKKLL
jgi:hypothetical protein